MKDDFVVKEKNYPYNGGNSVPALCTNAYMTLSTSKFSFSAEVPKFLSEGYKGQRYVMGPGRAYIHTKRLSFKHHGLVDLEAFKPHHISVQKLKECTKERSHQSCFFFLFFPTLSLLSLPERGYLKGFSAEE